MKNDVRTARLKNWEPGKKHVQSFDIVPRQKLPAGLLDFDQESIVRTIDQGRVCTRAFLDDFLNQHMMSFREYLEHYRPPEFGFLRYRRGPIRERILRLLAGC